MAIQRKKHFCNVECRVKFQRSKGNELRGEAKTKLHKYIVELRKV